MLWLDQDRDISMRRACEQGHQQVDHHTHAALALLLSPRVRPTKRASGKMIVSGGPCRLQIGSTGLLPDILLLGLMAAVIHGALIGVLSWFFRSRA
jgi:hypothetical protein